MKSILPRSSDTLLDTDLLLVFCWVAQTHSFSRAATELGTSQPVITRKVGKLEEALGTGLFTRNSRGCQLTLAGEALVPKAAGLLLEMKRLREEVQQSAHEVSGEISMGITDSASTLMAPHLLPNIAEHWPQLRVNIVQDLSRALVERVLQGELDFGILYDPPPHPDLIATPLLIERLCVVGRPQSALKEAVSLKVRDLANMPLVLPIGKQTIRILLEDAFADIGETLNPVYEASSMSMLRAMAVQGLGYTLLTHGSVAEDVSNGKLISRPLAEKGMSVSLTVISMRQNVHSRNVQLLTKYVADQIRTVARRGQWPGNPIVFNH